MLMRGKRTNTLIPLSLSQLRTPLFVFLLSIFAVVGTICLEIGVGLGAPLIRAKRDHFRPG